VETRDDKKMDDTASENVGACVSAGSRVIYITTRRVRCAIGNCSVNWYCFFFKPLNGLFYGSTKVQLFWWSVECERVWRIYFDIFLDLKLSPCVKCNMFSFGCFPGV
jgi:hypothetical protein